MSLTYDALPESVRRIYPWPGADHEVAPGVKQHYVDVGEGEPILMVHGNPTWSFYYRNLIHGLSDSYRCIAVDHVGCGRSDKPQDYEYRLANHIDNLVALIEKLDLNNLTVVVHDWGGAIGLGAAERVPERIKRLVLFNTGVFDGPLPASIKACRWPLVGDVVIRGFNGFLGIGLLRAIADRKRLANGVEAGFRAPYKTRADRITHLRFVQDIPLEKTHPTRATFEQVGEQLHTLADRPALIIWGEQDFCFTPAYRKQFEEQLPNAEVHPFDDANHWVIEDAHERIVPLMRDFLARHP